MLDPNSWFYTLSAIPQTLAAMFALTIAVLVYRFESLDKVIERDIIESRPFLFPIFKEIEIHQIEEWSSRVYLQKLDEAVTLKLKRDDENLGLPRDDYIRLCELFEKSKIRDEYKRYYSPDKNRIYGYLLFKRNNIRIHVYSKSIIRITFSIAAFFTVMVIYLSLSNLPDYTKFSSDILETVKRFALINTVIIGLSVFLMAFTKHILQPLLSIYSLIRHRI